MFIQNSINNQATKMLPMLFFLNKRSHKCMTDKMLSHNDTKAFKKEESESIKMDQRSLCEFSLYMSE